MNLPDDADGDVLRKLRQDGLDLSKRHLIDFNVDFEDWPPPAAAVEILRRQFPSTKLYEPDGEDHGYIQFQVYELPSYTLVTGIQAEVSRLMIPFNGKCCSWGLLHS